MGNLYDDKKFIGKTERVFLKVEYFTADAPASVRTYRVVAVKYSIVICPGKRADCTDEMY